MGGDGATSDLWGLKRRKEKVEGKKMMEEVGRQVLTNAQPAMQPGLWGGTEVRKALSKRDGEALLRRGQLGDGDPSAARPRMALVAVSPWTHHCWGGTGSVLCAEEGVSPQPTRGTFPPGAQGGVRQLLGVQLEPGQQDSIQECLRQPHHTGGLALQPRFQPHWRGPGNTQPAHRRDRKCLLD